MNVLRNALLWGSQNRWLERQFRNRRFARRAISRFIPGEGYGDALDASERLAQQQITGIVTNLGENLTSLDEAEQVVAHYTDVLTQVESRGLDTHISIKLTHLGLDLDRERAEEHLSTLVDRAAAAGNFVWIDMEASNYVDVTLDVYRRALDRKDNVGICVQSYLRRTQDDVTDLLDRGAVVRLVKGAYNEPPAVAFPKKRDVDENYLALAGRLLQRPRAGGPSHAIATHDLKLIEEIRRLAAATDGARYEVDMLYGIRADHQLRLAAAGVPVRVLISYGDAWFAWYMRRLAERPANVGFVIRTMFGG